MSKYAIKALIVLLMGSFGVTTYLRYENNKLREEVGTLYNNNYAYEQDYLALQDSMKKDRGVYLFSIKQIKNSKDSIVIKLDETRKELKIKDKELKEMTHFAASIKTDTTINITNIINDSCEFDLKIKYNPQTIFEVYNKRINGQDSLTHSSDISSSFQGYVYEKQTWKEPNFFKRLFLFKWGKDKTDRSVLIPDNDKIKVKDFKVIRVKE